MSQSYPGAALRQSRAQVMAEKRIWGSRAVCGGTPLQRGAGVILQVVEAPASEWELGD